MNEIRWLVGIDEAGRGPLAGPLSFGAVALRPQHLGMLEGIQDSKRLTDRARERWHEDLATADEMVTLYGEVDTEKIDAFRMGRVIVAGSYAIAKQMLGMLDAPPADVLFLLDGGLRAPTALRQVSIIDGDAQLPIIAAASVVAKVRRDRAMRRLHCRYPQYGFSRHKGYGTKVHRAAIEQHGPSPVHRRSFRLL